MLNRMADQAEARLEEFSAQNISNALTAYAKLDHSPEGLLAAIAKSVLPKLHSFSPQVRQAPYSLLLWR